MHEMNMKITYKQKKQTTFGELVYGDIFEFTDTRMGQTFIKVNTGEREECPRNYCVRLNDGVAFYSTPNEAVVALCAEMEVDYK